MRIRPDDIRDASKFKGPHSLRASVVLYRSEIPEFGFWIDRKGDDEFVIGRDSEELDVLRSVQVRRVYELLKHQQERLFTNKSHNIENRRQCHGAGYYVMRGKLLPYHEPGLTFGSIFEHRTAVENLGLPICVQWSDAWNKEEEFHSYHTGVLLTEAGGGVLFEKLGDAGPYYLSDFRMRDEVLRNRTEKTEGRKYATFYSNEDSRCAWSNELMKDIDLDY